VSDKIGKHQWELGLFAASVPQLTAADTISLLLKENYRWVEWRVQTREAIESSPWGKAYNTLAIDDLAAEASELAHRLEDAGVGVCGIQVDVPEDYPDAQKNVIEAARTMNCNRIILTGPTYDPSIGYRVQRDAFQQIFASWVKDAENTGIKICLENHMWTIVPSIAFILDLLGEFNTSQIGVIWDPANGYWEGLEVPSMVIDLLGDLLEEVHFKNGSWARKEDGSWAYNWNDISEGLVDWPSVLQLLDQVGYKGPLVVEDYRQATPEEKITKGREGLEKTLAAIKNL